MEFHSWHQNSIPSLDRPVGWTDLWNFNFLPSLLFPLLLKGGMKEKMKDQIPNP